MQSIQSCIAVNSVLRDNIGQTNVLKSNGIRKRVSFGSRECIKELKLECAYILGQTS